MFGYTLLVLRMEYCFSEYYRGPVRFSSEQAEIIRNFRLKQTEFCNTGLKVLLLKREQNQELVILQAVGGEGFLGF